MPVALTTLLAVMAGCAGAIIGSFLNVVIYRLPRGIRIGMSRSQCPDCGSLVAWYDNIPLLSWIVLLGRCRSCGWRIPVRYPLVEAITAALFSALVFAVQRRAWDPPTVAWAVSAAFSAVVVAAAFIDWDHKILPDSLTKRFGPVIALVGVLIVNGFPPPEVFGADLTGSMKPGAAALVAALAGALVGGGLILSIRQLGTWILGKEAMGLGDVKFMGMAGLLLGPDQILLAIAVALLVGAVVGLLIWAITRSREIPFGPFLAVGVMAALLYGPQLEHLLLDVYPAWIAGR
ncbi:MAG: prepilin peptidase [Planctomycetota bacterium]|jgi:leader peptidase (prepilin peptidase)/N-methyltransferase